MVIEQDHVQLTLDMDPGLSERYSSLKECVGDMGIFEGNVRLPRPPTGSLDSGAVEQWRK